MSQFAGTLVFLVTFFVPLVFRDFRRNGQAVMAYWFVLAFHHAVALVNAYWFTVIGADADAETFHRIGTELARSGDWSFAMGARGYEQFLGRVYYLFGPSHLLGQSLSVLAFALSCGVLFKLMTLVGIHRHRVPVLLVFGGLPTMVLLGSVTLRESFQILFFMLTVYFAIKFHLRRNKASLLGMLLAALAMGLFHKGLMLYAVFLILVAAMWRTRPKRRSWTIPKSRSIGWALALVAIGGVLVSPMLMPEILGLEVVRAVVQGEGLEFLAQYRESMVPARATYGITLDTSSLASLVLTAIPVFIYYLFAPFPWQVHSVVDLYAAFESVLRLVLIVFSVKAWQDAQGPARRICGFYLLLYFSMAFLWALGTNNYGTSIRHHTVHFWIIVVMGVPPLVAFLKRGIWPVVKSTREHGRRQATRAAQ